MSRKLKLFLMAIVMATLGACGSGQHVFYWERPNTGAVWFVRDHNQCLAEADYWPFEWPGVPWGWGTPKDLDLRFQNEANNGIWAQFTPMPGAQPVYMNSVAGDWSMSADRYQECMEKRDYVQRKPKRIDHQIFYQ